MIAENRARDVFFGVDVHGRGTFGGGGFNTDIAVETAIRLGASSAIFAPGWTHENHRPDQVEMASRLFWDKIE